MVTAVAVAGGALGLCASLILFKGLSAPRQSLLLVVWFLIVAVLCAFGAVIVDRLVTSHWVKSVVIGGIGGLGGFFLGVGHQIFGPFANKSKRPNK